MQYCPLCKTQYNDIAKVCPLEHCVNCGSLDLRKQTSRSFVDRDTRNNFIGFTSFGLIFIAFYTSVVFLAKGEWEIFTIIMILTLSVAVLVFLNKTRHNSNCRSCQARNFKPIEDTKLRKGKKKKEDMNEVVDDEHPESTTEISKSILENLSLEQKKHNRRDLFLKILGLVATAVILIIANFITNPQQILLETSRGTIPIDQNPIFSWLLRDGEHGATYIDKKLGFMIEKPDENWLFIKDLGNFKEKGGLLPPDEFFLGGILVGRHTGESVFVAVFNDDEVKGDLSSYIQQQLNASSILLDTEVILKRKFVSSENNYAYFEAETTADRLSGKIYGSQILRLYNGKLYMIQHSADPPDTISDERNEEIKEIIKTFRIIS